MNQVVTVGVPLPGIPTLTITYEFGAVPLHPYPVTIINPIPLRPDVDVMSDIAQEWKKEIGIAVSGGRTIIVFMNRFEQDFYFERPCHNFEFLPSTVPALLEGHGKDIQLTNSEPWLPVWKLLSPYLQYSAVFDGTFSEILGLSKQMEKPVAGVLKMGKGRLILLPEIDWEHPDLMEDEEWTEKAMTLINQLIDYFARI